jgi:GNAT superfamily N-acetyltransferase
MTKIADLELRPATLDDASLVADIDTELHPDDAEDPTLMRHWWSMTPPDDVSERTIALLGGAPAGYTMRRHPAWAKVPERFTRISAELRPSARTAERLDALYERLEQASRADGTAKVTSWAWEFDALRIGALTKRGFREERRERFWELDLVEGRDRITTMAKESRARMTQEGIRVLTLGDDTDPKKFEKLKRMSDEAESDVPSTVPHVPFEMNEFMKWFESPALRMDRIWIARDGDDIVGISMLAYPPVRGVVATDWTGMARKARGRGIARALKCETLTQAIALGVDRVRTDNDSTNAPILHINETMGYRRRPDMVQYLKVLG